MRLRVPSRGAWGCLPVAMALLAALPTPAAEETAAVSGALTARVTNVSAGDHLRVTLEDGGWRVVALEGVHCPHFRTEAGQRAKQFTAARAEGQTVQVTPVREFGKVVYGRVVLPDGRDLAGLLLAQGLAKPVENAATAPLEEERPMPRRAERPVEDAEPSKGLTGIRSVDWGGRAEWEEHEGVRKQAFEDPEGVPTLRLKGDPEAAAAARAAFQAQQRQYFEQLEARRRAAEEQARAAAQPPASAEDESGAGETAPGNVGAAGYGPGYEGFYADYGAAWTPGWQSYRPGMPPGGIGPTAPDAAQTPPAKPTLPASPPPAPRNGYRQP